MSKTVKDLSKEENDGELQINATAYYPFNGNANDESVNSNDGTVTGATLTTDRFGNENNAYLFDGTSQRISLVSSNSLISNTNGWSVFGVFTPSTGNSEGIIINFHRGTSSGSSINIQVTGTTLRLQYTPDGTNFFYINLGTYIVNNTYYFAVSYDGTTLLCKMYGENLVTNTVTIIESGTFPAYIGSFAGTTSGQYYGKIDEIGIINNIVLTESEMDNLFNVLISHKLDKPLVTKTDSDGNTITGYELTGKGDLVNYGGVHWGNYVDLGNLGINSETTVSYYGQFMLAPEFTDYREFIIGGEVSVHNTISIGTNNHSTSRLIYFRQDDETLASNILIDRNKIYQYYISYEYDSVTPENSQWNMVITDSDGNILDNKTRQGFDNFYSKTMRLGYDSRFSRQMRGVLSKPLIFNRVLTEQERNDLFSGINIVNPKGDIYFSDKLDEIRIYSDTLSTESVIKINNKIQVMDDLVGYWAFDDPIMGNQSDEKEKVQEL
jgi:hypothetical protein